MSKKLPQTILALAIGIVAMVVVSWAFLSVINAESYSILIALSITAVVFLVLGVVVGLFWRGGGLLGGVLLASPFLLATILSVLFSGFLSRFFTNDLPILVTAILAGVMGCYLGQRVTPVRATSATD